MEKKIAIIESKILKDKQFNRKLLLNNEKNKLLQQLEDLKS
jgi:hypothetical protein